MCGFGCSDGCVLWRQCHLPISHYCFSSAAVTFCYVQQKVSSGFIERTEVNVAWKSLGLSGSDFWDRWRLQVRLFYCCRFCKIPLISTNWIPPVTLSPPLPPSLTSFCRSIFRVHSNTLFPSPALPPLQSYWPILWRTVKDRRSVYCLASFLGQWDSADVCMLPSHPPAFVSCPPLPCKSLWKLFREGGKGGWLTPHFSTSVGGWVQILFCSAQPYSSFLRKGDGKILVLALKGKLNLENSLQSI